MEEENLIIELCHPKLFRKDIQTKSNLIVALRPYITGEMITKQDTKPPKQSRKSKPEQKKYQKRQKPEEEEVKLLEYSQEEEEELQVVPPGGQISSGVLLNRIKFERILLRRSLCGTVNSSIFPSHLFITHL